MLFVYAVSQIEVFNKFCFCSKQITVHTSLFFFLWSHSNQVAIINNTKHTFYFRKLQKIASPLTLLQKYVAIWKPYIKTSVN